MVVDELEPKKGSGVQVVLYICWRAVMWSLLIRTCCAFFQLRFLSLHLFHFFHSIIRPDCPSRRTSIDILLLVDLYRRWCGIWPLPQNVCDAIANIIMLRCELSSRPYLHN